MPAGRTPFQFKSVANSELHQIFASFESTCQLFRYGELRHKKSKIALLAYPEISGLLNGV